MSQEKENKGLALHWRILIATVNMNGTALYECMAAIFIAQAFGVLLVFDRILDMSRTATNVFGDASCTVIIANLQCEELPELQRGTGTAKAEGRS